MPRIVPVILALTLGVAACTARRGGAAHRAASQDARADLLIAGGLVVDGTGAPGFRADVAVRDGRIVRVSRAPLPRAAAARVVDASGLVVAPGFIDLHAHIEELLRFPAAENYLRQGVTTLLGNPDGGLILPPPAPWPLGPYLDSVARTPLGPNVAYYVGHNLVRRAVLGLGDRAPTPVELDSMRALVAQGMGLGAFGLSTGLIYLPGTFSTTDEVVALARVAADSGGIYTSHIRDEGDRDGAAGLLRAVAEAVEIGRRARMPVVIDHHKALGSRAWGMSVRTLALVDSARSAGVDVMLNQYPYTAASTTIASLVPAWALAGGDTALLRRLREPELRDSISHGVAAQLTTEFDGDLRRVLFAGVAWDSTLQGRTLYDWAVARRLAPTLETGAVLVLDAMRRGGARVVKLGVMDERDVERIMRHPQTMIASDGRLAAPGEGHPHPRGYGTFPRVLGVYVRERHVLSLEAAVHKMSGMPAARLGLADRGRVTEGAWADLVVFDPATVADRATYAAPHQYPVGVPYVLVNGAVAVDHGRLTSARAGRLLRHTAHPHP